MKGLAYLKRRNSILVRTLITYMLIFTIPFAIFGISIYYWASSTVTSQTNRTYLGLLEDARKDVERSFEGLDTCAWANGIVRRHLREVSSRLRDRLSPLLQLRRLYVFDRRSVGHP